MIDGEQNFTDTLHALKAGVLLGLLLKADIRAEVAVDDDGDYMNLITLTAPDMDFTIQISVLP